MWRLSVLKHRLKTYTKFSNFIFLTAVSSLSRITYCDNGINMTIWSPIFFIVFQLRRNNGKMFTTVMPKTKSIFIQFKMCLSRFSIVCVLQKFMNKMCLFRVLLHHQIFYGTHALLFHQPITIFSIFY